MKTKDNLGDRMKKNYEDRSRNYLTRRTPVIIRLDGKAFHTFTRNMQKPFSGDLNYAMRMTALKLFNEVQGCKLAYVQSDEISLLLTDYDTIKTDAWFDYNIQKMVSVSASIATVAFNKDISTDKDAYFDSRCFNIPKEEVSNYFVWRCKDWYRNSIQLLAQSLYSHKELHKKSCSDLQEMCFAKGQNWAYLPSVWKNGTFISKNGFNYTIQLPRDRKYIEDLLVVGE